MATSFMRILVAIAILFHILIRPTSAQSNSQAPPTVGVSVDPFVNIVRNSTALCLGQFEILGFPRGRMTVGSSRLGKANTRRFSLQFSDSATARIYIYPKDAPREIKLSGPCNVSEEARSKAILAGRVSEAVILGWMQGSESGLTAISIPVLVRRAGKLADGLSLVVSELAPAARSVIGGTIELGKGSVAVENRDQDLDVTELTLKGFLRLKSSEGHLKVSVGFEGDPQRRQTLPFELTGGAKADVKLDGTTGLTTLQNGSFQAQDFSPTNAGGPSADFKLGRLLLAYNDVKAKQISLTANEGSLRFSVMDAAFGAVRGTHETQPQLDVTDIKAATVSSIRGTGEPTDSGVELKAQAAKNIELTSGSIQLSTGSLSLDGPGKIEVKVADEKAVDGSINYDSASAKKLGGVAETAVLEQFVITGLSNNTAYSGSVSGRPTKLRLGRALMTPDGGEIGGRFGPDGELALHIKSDRTGAFAITGGDDSDPEFEAALAGAALQGRFSPAMGTLNFPSNGVNLKLQGLTASAARMLGGIPFFGTELMQLQNASPILLNQNSTIGSMDFSSKLFSVKNPTVWTAAKDYTLPLGGDLSTVGSTALKAVLGTGDIFPVSGILALDNINITLPDGINSVTFRISGMDLEAKYFKIERFEIRPSLDVASLSAKIDLLAKKVELGVVRVAHTENPMFQGTATDPVTVESLSGGVKLGRDPLQFTGLTLQNGSVKLKDASYATPDQLQFQTSAAVLTLGTLTETQAKGNVKLINAHVHTEGADSSDASVKELNLQFSGTKSDPIASGTIRLDTINFVSQSGIRVDNCGNNYLPIRISVQAGGLEGPISVSGGKTSFLFASNDAQVQLFRDVSPLWQCEWDQKIGELSISYPCCDNWCGGFIKYPCDCHICTHKISDINVRWQMTVGGFQSSGLVTQIKLKPDPSKGIKPCEGHMTQLNPPLIGTFALHPTIPGGNIVSDTVRTAITASVAPAETVLANSAGLFGSVVSLTHVGDRFYLFGGCD
jgi:hypothetical protein